MFLFSGALNILKQLRITKALDEIVRFINLVKTEVHYTTADFENIFLKGKAQKYKYLSFSDDQIYLDKSVGVKFCEDFNGFISKIGTTDDVGQLNICEEYKDRFEEVLARRKAKEKEKLQVNTALSLFGALTVLIFFL
jgi:hypothetical protein